MNSYYPELKSKLRVAERSLIHQRISLSRVESSVMLFTFRYLQRVHRLHLLEEHVFHLDSAVLTLNSTLQKCATPSARDDRPHRRSPGSRSAVRTSCTGAPRCGQAQTTDSTITHNQSDPSQAPKSPTQKVSRLEIAECPIERIQNNSSRFRLSRTDSE
jgi:hypothetical protein